MAKTDTPHSLLVACHKKLVAELIAKGVKPTPTGGIGKSVGLLWRRFFRAGLIVTENQFKSWLANAPGQGIPSNPLCPTRVPMPKGGWPEPPRCGYNNTKHRKVHSVVPEGTRTSPVSNAGLEHAKVIGPDRRVSVRKWRKLCKKAMSKPAYNASRSPEERRLRKQMRAWSISGSGKYEWGPDAWHVDWLDVDDCDGLPVDRHLVRPASWQINLLQIEDVDNHRLWLPFASGPTCYYWLNLWGVQRGKLSQALHTNTSWASETSDGVELRGKPYRLTRWMFLRHLHGRPDLNFGTELRKVCLDGGDGPIRSYDDEKYFREQLVLIMMETLFPGTELNPEFDEFYRFMEYIKRRNKTMLLTQSDPQVSRPQFAKWLDLALVTPPKRP